MRIQTLVPVLVSLFWCVGVYAQNIIRGKIVDNNKKPLAFANIGIANTGIGTISNEDGSFQLNITNDNLKDTISISLIGYSNEKVCVNTVVNKYLEILLSENTQLLQTVIVTSKPMKAKSYVLGNPSSHGGIVGVDTVYSGAAYALLIDNKEAKDNKQNPEPLYLDEVRININKNNAGKFKLRLQICDIDSATFLPNEDKIKTSLVKEWDLKDGFVDYDLTQYQLMIDHPFFIVAELIQTDEDKRKIANCFNDFKQRNAKKVKEESMELDGENVHLTKLSSANLPITMLGMDNRKAAIERFVCYTRSASFGKWQRIPIILTATAIVSN